MNEYEKQLQLFLKKKLRRISLHWPARTEAKVASRINRGEYVCRLCGGIFSGKQIELDHIIPVVSKEYETFEEWLIMFTKGLFCPSSNFQTLCSHCHLSKSMTDNNIKSIIKKKGKKK